MFTASASMSAIAEMSKTKQSQTVLNLLREGA